MDASTSENGPLRVLPGSHVAGVLTDEEVFVCTARHEAAECLVGRGGGVVMRPLLIHASSRARTQAPRRVLHIEYAESLQLDPIIRLAVAALAHAAEFVRHPGRRASGHLTVSRIWSAPGTPDILGPGIWLCSSVPVVPLTLPKRRTGVA